MSDFLQYLESKQQSAGAVILAGGLARRMQGIDKGLVEVAGRSMAAWALAAVKPTVHQLVINANRNHDKYGLLGVSVVADNIEGHVGPLAGLSAGITALQCDYVFMCPCDSPFVDGELVSKLGMACSNSQTDIAVAHDGERMQPVFCMVKSEVLTSLNAFLLSGERKIDRWYATLNTEQVDCRQFQASFQNINTEEDRLLAEQQINARDVTPSGTN